jgi:hypothetical protein
MPDSIRRGLRTTIQVLLAACAGMAGLVAVHVISAEQGGKAAAVCTFLAGLIAAAMNALEDRGTIPALLKAPASEGANPVPDPPT